MINGRELSPGTLLYTAFASPNGHPDIDLRAIRVLNNTDPDEATRRFVSAASNAAGGFGCIVRSMTTVERDALLTVYEADGHIDPENPGAGPVGDVPNGAIVYNTTDNSLDARINGAWVQLGAAGAIPNLQGAYNGGAGINLAAATPITITDDELAAIQAIRINKTGAQGAGTIGRGLYVNLDAAPVDIAGYRGYEFDATGQVQGEAFRATMGVNTDLAINIPVGAVTLTDGALLMTLGDFTMTAGNQVITLGNLTLTNGLTSLSSTSNAANTVSIINNTVTTWGAAAADRGIFAVNSTSLTTGQAVHVRADALTTGTLLHLETSEAGGPTGLYLRCYNGATNDFSVSAVDGRTVIAGTAAGTAALTLTAGDAVITAGDIDLDDGQVRITQAQTGEEALTIIANGSRTVSGVTFASSGSSAAGFSDFLASHTGAVILAGSSYAATWANTSAATGAMFLGTLSGAAAHSARIFDAVNSSATATTGAAYRVTFSGGAHTGHAFHAAMGTNLAGQGLLIARSGVTTGSSIVVTHAAASTSAGGPDLDLDGSNTATTWIGQRIRSATGAVVNTGRLLEVAQRATGAATGNSIFSDAGTGSSATLVITSSGAKTGAAAAGIAIGSSAAVGADYRALLLDGTLSGATWTACDIIGSSDARSVPLVDIADASTGAGAGFLYTISGTASGILFDINISGARSGNLFDVAYSAAATGTAYNIAMTGSNVAARTWVSTDDRLFTTAAPYHYTFSGAFADATAPAVRYDFTGAHTVNGFEIRETSTASGNAFRVVSNNAAYEGDLVAIDLGTNSLIGQALVITGGAAARTTDLVSVTDGTTSTGSSLRWAHTGTSQATDGVWDLDFAFGNAANVAGVTLGITQTNAQDNFGYAQVQTVGTAGAGFAATTVAHRVSVMSGVTGAFSHSGDIDVYSALFSAAGLDAGQGFDGTVTGFSVGFTPRNDAAEGGTFVAFGADDVVANAATGVRGVDIGTGFDVAFRAASGGIEFITASQNIVWGAGIAAGLHFRTGQSLVMDANAAAPGTDTATINTGATSIRLAGALRPTKALYRRARDFIADGWDGFASAAYADTANDALGSVTMQVMAFDGAATTEIADTAIAIPADMVAGTAATIRIFWYNIAGGAGNVEWAVNYLSSADGGSMAAGLSTTAAVATVAAAVDVRTSTDLTIPAGAGMAAGETLFIQLIRAPLSGTDTYGSDALVLGIEFRYTSDTP